MHPVTHCKPVIFGCSDTKLSSKEAAFFSNVKPFGFILFKRNITDPEQVKALVKDLRESVGRSDVPIFIDNEGGRVARLKPPHWPSLPAMRVLGEIYERNEKAGLEAIRLHSLIKAHRLIELGINGNCAPVLDLMIEGADNVIGDRAFSNNPFHVAKCAKIVIDTFLASGVLPIIKHMPGHGRVTADPHIRLAHVDADYTTLETEDFIPFKELKDAPMAMNCHVVFNALDTTKPASLSPKIHKEIMRGVIGYEGMIVSDDLAMGALTAPLEERGIEALNAGADIIMYCSGNLDEMKKLSTNLPDIKPESQTRWIKAKQQVSDAMHNKISDIKSVEDELNNYLS